MYHFQFQVYFSSIHVQVVYAVRGSTVNSHSPLPAIPELREKYTYNIYPCGVQLASEGGGAGEGANGDRGRPMAPLPSRGGSFAAESGEESKRRDRESKEKAKDRRKAEASECGSNCLKRAFWGEEEIVDTTSGPVEQQIRQLNKHYYTVARQPSHVRCNMQMTPPIARAYCPQQQRDPNPIPYYTAYAADVPLDVVQQSRALSGFDQLSKLQEYRKEQFVLSFTDSPELHHPSSLPHHSSTSLPHHTSSLPSFPLQVGAGKKRGGKGK